MLNKTAFAKRCGVSVPTVYAWISKNRDGIQDFLTADGIQDEIFLHEPWSRYQPVKKSDVEKLKDENAGLSDELQAAHDQIDALRRDLELKEQTVNQLNKMLEMLQAQMTVKDQQINALLVSLNQQMKALPKPRRTLKEFFTGKRKDQD